MTVFSLYMIQFFGQVQPPPGVAEYDAAASATGGLGLVIFVSNIIRLIMIVGGLFAFFNLILAGFTYIVAANNVKAVETAWQSILLSLIGLGVMVGSFTLTAIFSYFLFGDPMFILNPTLKGVPTLSTP